MRSSLLRMRSSLERMRSSQVVRASDCQCTSCNGPEFDPSIPSAQGNLRGGRWSNVEWSTKTVWHRNNQTIVSIGNMWPYLRAHQHAHYFETTDILTTIQTCFPFRYWSQSLHTLCYFIKLHPCPCSIQYFCPGFPSKFRQWNGKWEEFMGLPPGWNPCPEFLGVGMNSFYLRFVLQKVLAGKPYDQKY